MYPWSCPRQTKITGSFSHRPQLKIRARSLTFDAKLGVSSKLENNQHYKETSEGYSSDAHHHVHLYNEKSGL